MMVPVSPLKQNDRRQVPVCDPVALFLFAHLLRRHHLAIAPANIFRLRRRYFP
jgi:hypothetical protein